MLAIEHRQQARQPFLDGIGFQQLLPLLQVQVQVHGHQVRKVPRILRVERGNLDLLGQRR